MTLKSLIEAKNAYVIYHDTYSAATTEIENYAKKNGYFLDDQSDKENIGDQMATKVGLGPVKPKGGKTNKFSFTLYTKTNNEAKKQLHAQIYNRETKGNEFELNMYIS